MKRIIPPIVLLCFASAAVQADEHFVEHLTDHIRHDLPANQETTTATAKLTITPRGGGPSVVWNIGSVPTEGPIATRRKTLTAANAAANGVDWNSLKGYVWASTLQPPIDFVEHVEVAPLTAELSWLSFASRSEYLIPHGGELSSIRFELTALGTNLNADPQTRSTYVGGTFRYGWAVPEPSSLLLASVALCGVAFYRGR